MKNTGIKNTDLKSGEPGNADFNKDELKNKVNGEAEDLLKMWEAEESIAYIHGWDFPDPAGGRGKTIGSL